MEVWIKCLYNLFYFLDLFGFDFKYFIFILDFYCVYLIILFDGFYNSQFRVGNFS